MEKIAPAVKTPGIIEPTKPIYRREEEKPELGPAPLIETGEDLPLDIFEKEEQKPYVMDYLKMDTPYPFTILGEVEQERLAAIDVFVKEEIELKGKKSNIKSYKGVLDSLKKRLGLDEDTQENTVLERFYGFIQAFNAIRGKQEKKQRGEVLKKLYKLARNKDFDAEDLEMLLIENYLKENEMWS